MGIPKVQKQTRQMRGIWYDPSKKDKENIQREIRPSAPGQLINTAIEMHLTFFMPIPKSENQLTKKLMVCGDVLPTKRPDFDNLAYLVTNALKGIVYVDDSQVIDCWIRKRYSEKPRTEITVIPIYTWPNQRLKECA